MDEKNRRKNKMLAIIFISVMIFLILMFFISQIVAFADPAAHNYRIERLKPHETVDGYLHTGENIISLVFMAILVVYLTVFLLLVLFKKNSMHLVMVVLGGVLFLAYTLTRIIYCFNEGSTSIIVALFYLGSLAAGCFMLYQFVRRGIDGDALTPYYAAAIICFGLYFFASATKSSYSLLNAYSHMVTIIDDIETGDSHSIVDVVYWGGYATTRLFALLYGLIIFVNMNFSFKPEEVLASEAEVAK